MAKISQREARRLGKRIAVLEDIIEGRRRVFNQEWFGGVNIATITYNSKDDVAPVAVRTARRLGHAVVVVGDDGASLRLIALPHPKQD